MTDQEVLNTIFPNGDLNNNYIEATGSEICTAQLIEPSLAVTQMNISDIEHRSPKIGKNQGNCINVNEQVFPSPLLSLHTLLTIIF